MVRHGEVFRFVEVAGESNGCGFDGYVKLDALISIIFTSREVIPADQIDRVVANERQVICLDDNLAVPEDVSEVFNSYLR